MNFMKKIAIIFEDLCYVFDFFKTPFNFHFSMKRRLISNKLGTLLSLLIIIYLIREIFYSDMIQKTNPSVLNQKDFGPTRPTIFLNKSNFEFVIGLFDTNLTNFDIDSSELKIVVTQNTIRFSDINNTLLKTSSEKIIELKNCTADDYHITHSKNLYSAIKCLNNFELITSGYVDQMEYSYFMINLYLCNNETSEIVCKPKEEILQKLKDKFFGIHYIDYNINYNNFSDPIVYTSQAEYIALDIYYKKITSIFLTKFNFLDDYDIFDSTPHKYEGFFRSFTESSFTINDETSENQLVARFYFASSQELQVNMRTYQKLNQLLSNIGGSASLFISIGFILMNFINDWTLRVKLFKKLYHLEEKIDELDQKNNENACKTEKIIENIDLKEKQKNNENNKILKNINKTKFFKFEMKQLKPDSFVLERYSLKEEIQKEKITNHKKKRKKISLWKHVIFKIKFFFGFKLNENNEIYRIIDKGYNNIVNGGFIYKKLQELEFLKKMILSEKEIILLNYLKSPKLEFTVSNISQNFLKNRYFGLYPINFMDEQLKKYDNADNLEKLFQEWVHESQVFKLNRSLRKKLMDIFSQHIK